MDDTGRRLDAWLTRHGVRGTARRDALLAVLVAVLTAVGLPVLLVAATAAEGPALGGGVLAVITAVGVAQALLLARRRSNPTACLLLIAALQLAVLPVLPGDVLVRGPAHLVAAYTVGAVLERRRAAVVLAGALAIEAVGTPLLAPGIAAATANLVNGALVYLLAALVGGYVATRRGYTALLRERADRAERDQQAHIDAATAAERTRMARELHDVAAHHLSGMVVQAAAAERLVARDPDAARAAMAAVRRQGRRTLDDLRLLVGVLRDPAAAEDGAPVPGLERLDELVEEARALGAEVDSARTGEPRPLPPLADVTFYRIAQQALTNARQHAPGAAVRVGLVFDEAGVELLVENDRPAPPAGAERPTGGVGVVGMRERAQLVGARLDVGPTQTGGWRVHVRLEDR